MAHVIEPGTMEICIRVTVHVDLTADELLARADQAIGPCSPADVVRSEVESNLESVSYVRHVHTECLKGARS